MRRRKPDLRRHDEAISPSLPGNKSSLITHLDPKTAVAADD